MEKETFREYRKKTIEMLTNYKESANMCKMLRFDIEALQQSIDNGEAINSNMAVNYSRISGGKTNKVNSIVEQEVFGPEESIKRLKDHLWKIEQGNKRIDHVLDCLPAVYSKLLRLRYIERKGWPEVRDKLGYSYSQAYVRKEMHEKALNMATGYLFNNVYQVGLFLMEK